MTAKRSDFFRSICVPDVLVSRLSDVRMIALIQLVRNTMTGHGIPLPSPLDGADGASDASLLLGQAWMSVQKAIIDIQALDADVPAGGRAPLERILALSKLKEADLALHQALQSTIDAHMLLSGGTTPVKPNKAG